MTKSEFKIFAACRIFLVKFETLGKNPSQDETGHFQTNFSQK